MWIIETVTNKNHLTVVAKTKTKSEAHDLALKMYYTKSRPSYINQDILKSYPSDEILKRIYITRNDGYTVETLNCETGKFVKGGCI